jgi:hypothetical protein
METIHDQSELTEAQKRKLMVRLYEVHHAICHWETKERVAKKYLSERKAEQTKIKKQLDAS